MGGGVSVDATTTPHQSISKPNLIINASLSNSNPKINNKNSEDAHGQILKNDSFESKSKAASDSSDFGDMKIAVSAKGKRREYDSVSVNKEQNRVSEVKWNDPDFSAKPTDPSITVLPKTSYGKGGSRSIVPPTAPVGIPPGLSVGMAVVSSANTLPINFHDIQKAGPRPQYPLPRGLPGPRPVTGALPQHYLGPPPIVNTSTGPPRYFHPGSSQPLSLIHI